ncbi:MAG: hypothetical protein AB7D47_10680 [Desulfovibrio sp.]
MRTLVSACGVLAALLCLTLFPASPASAVMGVGQCVKSCDGDKACIKDCRDLYLSKDEAKELYMQEFRSCFDTCYDLRGQEKRDCLDGCRGDYKQGRDLD